MQSRGRPNQKKPSGCLPQLIQLLLQFLRWLRPPEPLPPQSLIKRPASPQRWRAAFDVTTAPFADPERLTDMLTALEELLAGRRARVSFSNYTGLARILRGDLYSGQTTSPQGMIDLSTEFVEQGQVALCGDKSGRLQLDKQPIIGSVVRFRQTDQTGTPVRGATVLCGFGESGQLTFISNTCYPIPSKVACGATFQLSWDEAAEIALAEIAENYAAVADTPSQVQKQRQSPPPPDLKAYPGDTLKDGRVILPWHSDEPDSTTKGEYRAAWVVRVVDHVDSHSWEVSVDDQRREVLAVAETAVEAVVSGFVYQNNGQALEHKPELKPFGDNIPSLENAPDFPMGGDEFAGPPISEPGSTINKSDPRFRSANVYYHLHHAKNVFTQIFANAFSGPSGDQLKVPGDTGNKVQVTMVPKGPLELKGGLYTPGIPGVPGTSTFTFGLGNPNHHTPIGDPALDCEVIYHEYAHAVVDVVQPDIFEYLSGHLFGNALNEGTAFYFGCTLSERPVTNQTESANEDTKPHLWGEFAYGEGKWKEKRFRDLKREEAGSQRPNYDYLQVYGFPPHYEANDEDKDPAGNKYACGMLWARTLWDIRRVLGYDTADAIVLRGLNLVGGVQSELETPAEAIIHADGEYAADGPGHENALRLIFCSRGITADAPIHELLTIKLGTQTYLLAATENTADDTPGCFYSADNGDTWSPLGTIDSTEGSPTEVVGLVAVEAEKDQNGLVTKAIIWAVSEHWADVDNNPTPRAKVHRYELTTGTLTNPTAWDEWATLPDKLNVLSLAAMKDDSGIEWVFAGTEKGIYSSSGGNWQKTPTWIYGQVFSLTIRNQPAQPQRFLLAATGDGPFVLIPDTMTEDQRYIDSRLLDYFLTLTMTADPEGEGHLWASVAEQGTYKLYHFDLNAASPKWEEDDDQIGRPVYCLLVEKKDGNGVHYAGTNNGVYRREGNENWQSFNQPVNPTSERIDRTTVVALCRAGNRLLAGTAQRGLWWCKPDEAQPRWTRSTAGLGRIGRLADARVPTDASTWSGYFTNYKPLPGEGVGTHVLYVPHGEFNSLSFTVEGEEAVNLALYYVAPHTNPSQGYAAGLQTRKLLESGGTQDGVMTMQEEIKPGYYILAVKAKQAISNYQIKVQL